MQLHTALVYYYLPKNTADLDSRCKNLALSSNHKTYNISLSLLQVSALIEIT
jgi:hypothetical protein